LVDLVHLAHKDKVKRFGLVGDDDIDCPALFLFFCELPTKCDDVGDAQDLCLVDGFAGIGALPGHDLAPVGAQTVKDDLDGAVGIDEVLFVEFLNVLLSNVSDDE
jgi:hypothetical protein